MLKMLLLVPIISARRVSELGGTLSESKIMCVPEGLGGPSPGSSLYPQNKHYFLQGTRYSPSLVLSSTTTPQRAENGTLSMSGGPSVTIWNEQNPSAFQGHKEGEKVFS